MSAESPKYIIEFTDADDPRKKDSLADKIETDDPLPIAAVGDAVYLPTTPVRLLRMERRMFTYVGDDYCHVQLFCREIEEKDI